MAKASRGNLIGFRNSKKKPGDDKPIFQGKLSLPGHADERGFALWSYTSKNTGQVLLSGRATLSATSQIETLTKPPAKDVEAGHTYSLPSSKDGGKDYDIKPNEISLFPNPQKDADNPERPDYFGYYNPGDGEPLQRVSAWARTDRNGQPMLTGSVEKYEPNRAKEQDMDAKAPPDTAFEADTEMDVEHGDDREEEMAR